MKTIRNITVLIGMLILLAFGAILFINDFLPLRERLLLLGLLVVLNLLLLTGVFSLRKGGAALSFVLFLGVVVLEAAGGYLVWSSIRTLDRVVVDQSTDPLETAQAEEMASVEDEDMPAFNIFLSGKDTEGEIELESRSDVNMILTVNPKTHTVQVTTIPRDTYLRIAGKGRNRYDKLTHAGNFGVESSVKTLENFFDIDIPYYAVVNFDSVVQIIDMMGGVDLYNPEEFTDPFYHYDKGNIHMNGDQALFFARERYGLKDGEMARGRNHIRLIEAMIKKTIQPQVILQYPNMLEVVAEEVITNMPRSRMISLVNYQISHNEGWDIRSAQLQGFETMGLPSYQIPNSRLYMFVPSMESMRDIRQVIQAVYDGKPVPDVLESSYSLHDEDYEDIPVWNFQNYLASEPVTAPVSQASDFEVPDTSMDSEDGTPSVTQIRERY